MITWDKDKNKYVTFKNSKNWMTSWTSYDDIRSPLSITFRSFSDLVPPRKIINLIPLGAMKHNGLLIART